MPQITGELYGEASGAKVFHVGAFPGPRIQGQPVAMTTLTEPGPFTLEVPSGRWYLHAVGGPTDARGFLEGTTWGSHGGIYGFGRPREPGEGARVHVSPLWRDLTHLPLHRQPVLTDEQWQAIHRAMATLKQDLSSSLEGDLEQAASLVRTRLSALFKRGTGLTVEEYRTRLRLEAAKALLVGSDVDVLEVSLEAGYSTPAQLGRMFRRYLGVAPGEFRRRARSVTGEAEPERQGGVRSVVGRWLARRGGVLRGEILYSGERRGVALYVGLFPRPVPDTYPCAWTALPGPGPFTLQGVPEGRYYLLATYVWRRMRYPGDLSSGFAYGGYGDVDTSGNLANWNPVPLEVRAGDQIGGLTVELVEGDAVAEYGRGWFKRFLPDGR